VTADTALRLGKFFKTGAAFWMIMQARFDLETAEDVLAPQIRKTRLIRGVREVMVLPPEYRH
jgi:plasmid maintenance system antidote protein VapI